MTRGPVLLWLIAMPACGMAAEYGGPLKDDATVAFFGITFTDTSTEGAYDGERADQTARVTLLEDEVRARFAHEGFMLLPTAPVADKLDTIANPADCNGCEVRFASELGADYALVGEVQKVSNLILSMNLVMRDAGDGEMVRGLSVDIRSNTDESWLRGMRYIFKNHFFKN
ncbi:hypothetical protein DEA8626_03939 [Defluviimonas aquaemixtae]|uniref:DUF2380 domain-containing protein n=1 Tax=Albidovulum aquaemixtae TaxID=1542388 RepID=A0A2R8BNG5_9RHOB|nr:DUF3280 domain-containing protein [Defluviimonas aquaemixtae]SPH24905.1 hypothetical protein DEA8626_03939 [Defluviimonas aquaemixtae]